MLGVAYQSFFVRAVLQQVQTRFVYEDHPCHGRVARKEILRPASGQYTHGPDARLVNVYIGLLIIVSYNRPRKDPRITSITRGAGTDNTSKLIDE
jgi:hypothetical protein